MPRTADEDLASHQRFSGVMVQTQRFPVFASVGEFADYAPSLPITTPVCGASDW
jgi:hypothetical protein